MYKTYDIYVFGENGMKSKFSVLSNLLVFEVGTFRMQVGRATCLWSCSFSEFV